jgi:hypothetical protein
MDAEYNRKAGGVFPGRSARTTGIYKLEQNALRMFCFDTTHLNRSALKLPQNSNNKAWLKAAAKSASLRANCGGVGTRIALMRRNSGTGRKLKLELYTPVHGR